jgi:hypothetical protein
MKIASTCIQDIKYDKNAHTMRPTPVYIATFAAAIMLALVLAYLEVIMFSNSIVGQVILWVVCCCIGYNIGNVTQYIDSKFK